jgi:glutaredoxin
MGKVILYTSDTCHRCKMVKKMLHIHSVEYTEVTDKDYMLELDIEEVPAIEVDNKIIDNYVSVLAWLQKHGYYSFEVSNDD